MARSDDTLLLLVRHAESLWNASGRWQGHGDPPLSPRGQEQAERLAESLADEPVDALVSSDLRRARATARALADALGIEPVSSPELRELDVGRWTGLSRTEIEAADAELLARFESEDPHVRPGGGESRGELRKRVRAAAESLAGARPGGTILVVAHLGVIRALVPGAEPANAQVLRVRWGDLRRRYT